MRIDIHAHYFAPEYISFLARLDSSEGSAAGRGLGPKMTLEEQVGLLDSVGIDLQVLSAGPAQPYSDNQAEAVEAARLGNDIFADIARGHGGRFAAFGAVPLPHAEQAVAETERCLDKLGMLGMTVGCSVVGRQLDDPAFEPFFAELDRRGAILFLHPVGTGAGPGTEEYGLTWMIGAPIEDTIAALRLVLSGLTTRHPNIRFVVPHFGGLLPFLMARFDYTIQRQRTQGPGASSVDRAASIEGLPSEHLRRLWFDTVNLHPPALRCACDSFGADRLMLGTDLPFLLGPNFTRCVTYVEQSGLPAEDVSAILDRNAQAFLNLAPR